MGIVVLSAQANILLPPPQRGLLVFSTCQWKLWLGRLALRILFFCWPGSCMYFLALFFQFAFYNFLIIWLYMTTEAYNYSA